MNDWFITDGPDRLAKAQRAALRESIAQKYADQLSSANFFSRLKLRFAMWRELHKTSIPRPSRKSLWSKY